MFSPLNETSILHLLDTTLRNHCRRVVKTHKNDSKAKEQANEILWKPEGVTDYKEILFPWNNRASIHSWNYNSKHKTCANSSQLKSQYKKRRQSWSPTPSCWGIGYGELLGNRELVFFKGVAPGIENRLQWMGTYQSRQPGLIELDGF